jgi:hypothetical protein
MKLHLNESPEQGLSFDSKKAYVTGRISFLKNQKKDICQFLDRGFWLQGG